MNQGEAYGFKEELLKEPYVQYLLKRLDQLAERVEKLTKELSETKDQISKLKGVPSRPRLTASKLDSPLRHEQGSVNKSEGA